MRYPTARSIKKLAHRFGLEFHPSMQDWEVEVADFSRVEEFIAAYGAPELGADDRFLLVELVIASLDEGVELGLDFDRYWRSTAELLRKNPRLHAPTLSYWSCGDDPDPDHHFAITPLVRPVWHELLADPELRGET